MVAASMLLFFAVGKLVINAVLTQGNHNLIATAVLGWATLTGAAIVVDAMWWGRS
jgi:hypothetical protein